MKPMVATNIAFYRNTHIVVGHSIPAGVASRGATDHGAVVVYDLLTGAQTCSVDFVSRLSWVTCFESLPIALFAADGRFFAADIFAGCVMARVALPAAAARSQLVPPSKDLGILLEHTTALETPVQLGSTGLVLSVSLTNDAGDPRKRLFAIDGFAVLAAAYPVIDDIHGRATVDQLAQVLLRVQDPAARHSRDAVLAALPPSGLGAGDAQRKSLASSAAFPDRRSSVGTAATQRLGASEHNKARSVASRAQTAESTARPVESRVVKPLPVGVPTTIEQRVQHAIDCRVATKISREAKFKALWQAMQP